MIFMKHLKHLKHLKHRRGCLARPPSSCQQVGWPSLTTPQTLWQKNVAESVEVEPEFSRAKALLRPRLMNFTYWYNNNNNIIIIIYIYTMLEMYWHIEYLEHSHWSALSLHQHSEQLHSPWVPLGPLQDFVKRRRITVPRSQQKVSSTDSWDLQEVSQVLGPPVVIHFLLSFFIKKNHPAIGVPPSFFGAGLEVRAWWDGGDMARPGVSVSRWSGIIVDSLYTYK